jgi:DNA-directed RNA polymerase subunit RPC12/RpoP
LATTYYRMGEIMYQCSECGRDLNVNVASIRKWSHGPKKYTVSRCPCTYTAPSDHVILDAVYDHLTNRASGLDIATVIRKGGSVEFFDFYKDETYEIMVRPTKKPEVE